MAAGSRASDCCPLWAVDGLRHFWTWLPPGAVRLSQGDGEGLGHLGQAGLLWGLGLVQGPPPQPPPRSHQAASPRSHGPTVPPGALTGGPQDPVAPGNRSPSVHGRGAGDNQHVLKTHRPQAPPADLPGLGQAWLVKRVLQGRAGVLPAPTPPPPGSALSPRNPALPAWHGREARPVWLSHRSSLLTPHPKAQDFLLLPAGPLAQGHPGEAGPSRGDPHALFLQAPTKTQN